jgi:hypothetical protein
MPLWDDPDDPLAALINALERALPPDPPATDAHVLTAAQMQDDLVWFQVAVGALLFDPDPAAYDRALTNPRVRQAVSNLCGGRGQPDHHDGDAGAPSC